MSVKQWHGEAAKHSPEPYCICIFVLSLSICSDLACCKQWFHRVRHFSVSAVSFGRFCVGPQLYYLHACVVRVCTQACMSRCAQVCAFCPCPSEFISARCDSYDMSTDDMCPQENLLLWVSAVPPSGSSAPLLIWIYKNNPSWSYQLSEKICFSNIYFIWFGSLVVLVEV